MAPKAGLSQAQKLEKILDYLRQSKTCHTLKDLESALPSAASVHKMQVKDMIKELTDENKVKVEKIGSGNWYWCWAGEEYREKKNTIAQLEVEKIKLQASLASLQERVDSLNEKNSAAEDDTDRQKLLTMFGSLEEAVSALTSEKESWENAVEGGVERVRADVDRWKGEAAEVTDNIYILEKHLQDCLGGDREMMDRMRRHVYDRYYVEDEGLPDVEGALNVDMDSITTTPTAVRAS